MGVSSHFDTICNCGHLYIPLMAMSIAVQIVAYQLPNLAAILPKMHDIVAGIRL